MITILKYFERFLLVHSSLLSSLYQYCLYLQNNLQCIYLTRGNYQDSQISTKNAINIYVAKYEERFPYKVKIILAYKISVSINYLNFEYQRLNEIFGIYQNTTLRMLSLYHRSAT